MADASVAAAVEDPWQEEKATDGRPRPADMPHLSVEGFDGPLDFLLEMVRRHRLDLGRLSIAALCDQFVAALEAGASRVPLDRQADWVVMASELVRLRAQLLIPATPEEAAAAEEEADRKLRQWEELRAMRAAAAWLSARPQLGHDVFIRGNRPRATRPQSEMLVAFLEATLTWMEPRPEMRGEERPVYQVLPPDVWTVPEALLRIREALRSHLGGGDLWHFGLAYLPAASPLRCRSAVASTFAAGLELARQGKVVLVQDRPFATILVRHVQRTSAHVP